MSFMYNTCIYYSLGFQPCDQCRQSWTISASLLPRDILFTLVEGQRNCKTLVEMYKLLSDIPFKSWKKFTSKVNKNYGEKEKLNKNSYS